MQGKQLYEYAIIRVVPRVERAEFINVGVLLYSKKTNFLDCRFHLSNIKIMALDSKADVELILQQLGGFQRIATGDKSCRSPIASLDKASRFRWLSASRSTIVQCSPIHPGYADDLESEVDRLMGRYVL